jgi:adenylate cyclase
MKTPKIFQAGAGRRTKSGRVAIVAAIALSAAAFLRATDPGPIAQLRERTFDAYQRFKPRPYGDYPVRIADIDEASLAALGQWPWPRTRLASLVKRLEELGAAAIVFDVIFSEPDRTSPQHLAADQSSSDQADSQRIAAFMAQFPDHDQVFAAAIEQAPVVIGFALAALANDHRPAVKAGFAFVGAKPQEALSRFEGATVNLDLLEKAASGIGGVNLSTSDTPDVVRRLPMLFTDGKKVYPSLAAEALRVAQQQQTITVRGTGASGELDLGGPALLDLRIGSFHVPLTSQGEVWLYYDHNRPQRYLSVQDILQPAMEDKIRPQVEGHILFVGASAAGLNDMRSTSLGELVPGVSIEAQAAEQILSQAFLFRPDWANGAEIVGMILLGAMLTCLLHLLRAEYAALIGAALIAAWNGVSWLAFVNFGLLFDPIYPSLGALLAYLSVIGVLYVASDRERKFVRQAFGQYLAPELLAKLEQKPQMLRLGGENRPITIMFVDVRDFTAISESLTAHELVEFINLLLSRLTEAIQGELGTIDKYIQNCVMAFWNAPLDIADHKARACRAALKMRIALADLNAQDAFGFRRRGLGEVRIGIGINTGVACVGNMGSQQRFNYSAMGDVVDTTARVQTSCRQFRVDIVISDDVAAATLSFAMLEGGAMNLKGKSRPVKLFALVGDEETAIGAEFKELRRHHVQLLAAIEARQSAEAAEALVQCRLLAGPLLSSFYDRFEDRIREFSDETVRLIAAK